MSGERVPPPGGETAPSCDDAAEIRNAVRSERAISIKAVVPLALVGLVIEVYRLIHG